MAQYVYNDIVLARYTTIQRPSPSVAYWGLTLLNTPTWFPLPSYYIAPHFGDEKKKIYSTSLTRQYISEGAYTLNAYGSNFKCHILIDNFYNGLCLGTYLVSSSLDFINIGEEGIEWSSSWDVKVYFRLCTNDGTPTSQTINGYISIKLNDNPIYFDQTYFETDGKLNQNDVNLSTYCCFSKNQQNKLTIMSPWWTGDVNSRLYIPFETMKQGNPVWASNLTTNIVNYKEYYTRDVDNLLTINFITLEDEAISDYSGTSSGYGTWDTSSDDIGLP